MPVVFVNRRLHVYFKLFLLVCRRRSTLTFYCCQFRQLNQAERSNVQLRIHLSSPSYQHLKI